MLFGIERRRVPVRLSEPPCVRFVFLSARSNCADATSRVYMFIEVSMLTEGFQGSGFESRCVHVLRMREQIGLYFLFVF